MENRDGKEQPLHILSVSSPREQLASPDILSHDGHHAAVMVVVNSTTGEIWINEEREEKEETGKQKGDVNVISETAKHGETALQTMSYGIIEEFLGRDNLTQTSQNLHLAWFHPQFCDYTPPAGNKPLSVAGGVFFYDGPDEHVRPEAVDEISTRGWMSIDSFLSHPQVRHSASHIVGLMRRRGVFQEAEAFHTTCESVPFYHVLQSSFNLQYSSDTGNYDRRLRQMDVTSSGVSHHRRPTLFVK